MNINSSDLPTLPKHLRAAIERATGAMAPAATKKPWSNAKPTDLDGIKFPSKMEAKVYERLKAGLLPGDRLYRQVRLPLLAIEPGENGIALVLSVDFCVVRADGRREYVDAKSKTRRSRDWLRGKKAAEATWNITIEESDR